MWLSWRRFLFPSFQLYFFYFQTLQLLCDPSGQPVSRRPLRYKFVLSREVAPRDSLCSSHLVVCRTDSQLFGVRLIAGYRYPVNRNPSTKEIRCRCSYRS